MHVAAHVVRSLWPITLRSRRAGGVPGPLASLAKVQDSPGVSNYGSYGHLGMGQYL